MSTPLKQLQSVLDQRRAEANNESSQETFKQANAEPAEGSKKPSYVVSLHRKGLNKILEKVGEESTEVILAAKDLEAQPDSKRHAQELAGEVADLWFHTLVMLSHLNLSIEDVEQVLVSRFGLSGIEEKRSRQHQ